MKIVWGRIGNRADARALGGLRRSRRVGAPPRRAARTAPKPRLRVGDDASSRGARAGVNSAPLFGRLRSSARSSKPTACRSMTRQRVGSLHAGIPRRWRTSVISKRRAPTLSTWSTSRRLRGCLSPRARRRRRTPQSAPASDYWIIDRGQVGTASTISSSPPSGHRYRITSASSGCASGI